MIRKIMMGGVFLSISFLLGKLLSFFYVPILSRYLGPEGMGTFNLAILITPWIISLSALSLPFIIAQLIAEQHTSYPLKTIIGTSLVIGFVFGLIATFLYFLLTPVIAIRLFHDASLLPYLQLGSPLILFSVIYIFSQGVVRGLKDFKRIAFYDFLKQFLNLVLGTFLLVLGYRVGGVILAMILSTVFVVLLYLYRNLRGQMLSFSFPLVRYLVFIGGGITFFGFLLTLLSSLDRFFLGTSVDKTTVGLYVAAASLITTSIFFPNSLKNSAFPYIAEYYAQGNITLAKRIIEQSLRYLLILIGVFFITMMLFRYEIITLLLGRSFLPAVPIFQLLLYSLPFQSIYVFLHLIIILVKEVRRGVVSLFFIVLLATLLYRFFVPLYGVLAAACLFVFGCFLISFCYSYLVWKKIPVHYGQTFLLIILQFLLVTVASFVLGSFFVKLLFGGGLLLVYGSTLFFCHLLTLDELRQEWTSLKEKIFWIFRLLHF